jgi:methylmalonyl-CoA mutase N-terminal domain/subunit
VGVNRFQLEPSSDDWSTAAERDHENGDVGSRQREFLGQIKAGRDAELVASELARVRRVARSSDNMMPVLLDAVKAYASVGEICQVLREEFGEFQEQDEI